MSKLSKRESQTARDPSTQAQFNISSEYNDVDTFLISNHGEKSSKFITTTPQIQSSAHGLKNNDDDYYETVEKA